MGNVRVLNGLLWTFNGLLGLGIVFFAWQYLFTSQESSALRDFVPEDSTVAAPRAAAAPRDDGPLKTLRNPVEQVMRTEVAKVATRFKATLKGTLPSEKDPKRGVAFIKSSTKNVELVAYMGEEIIFDGKPYDEFMGWKLVEVSKDRALFSDGVQKQELFLDQSVAAGPGGASSGSPAHGGAAVNRAGTPYDSSSFQSRLLAQSEGRFVWGMDGAEIDWAVQNAETIMDSDFQVSPHANGGLKIDNVRAGSIGAARGLQPNDVLRSVNGQALNNIADLKVLMSNPAMRRTSGLTLTVERNGKPVVVEYRPLPGAAVPGQPPQR